MANDGSTDGTADQLRALKGEFPRLRVVRILKNSGETAAMDAGFKHARGELIATVDADLQNDPADIPKMVAMMKDWDVVCGVRAKREDSLPPARLLAHRERDAQLADPREHHERRLHDEGRPRLAT